MVRVKIRPPIKHYRRNLRYYGERAVGNTKIFKDWLSEMGISARITRFVDANDKSVPYFYFNFQDDADAVAFKLRFAEYAV